MAWFSCSKTGGGNSKDSIVTFNPAEKRENISSGEKHKTIFGKIAKYFSDLKPVAFTGSYNDLQDKPSNLAPASHRHSKSDITDFPSSMPASDVYAWAKASSKPAYTAAEVGALPVTGGTVTGDVIMQGVVAANVTIGRRTGCQVYNEYAGSGVYKLCLGAGNASNNSVLRAVKVSHVDFATAGDNELDLGTSSKRWKQIYATNGTIQTSDRNEKKEISYIGTESGYDTCMTDEQLIKLILGLKPVVFKRINGESGRPHHGIIAQDFEELMTGIGLNDHAAFIKSPKTEEIETIKEDGSKEIKIQEIPGEYMYGIRYEEFISDLIRFCQLLKDENSRQQKKIEDLEKRIKILEDIIKQGA